MNRSNPHKNLVDKATRLPPVFQTDNEGQAAPAYAGGTSLSFTLFSCYAFRALVPFPSL